MRLPVFSGGMVVERWFIVEVGLFEGLSDCHLLDESLCPSALLARLRGTIDEEQEAMDQVNHKWGTNRFGGLGLAGVVVCRY